MTRPVWETARQVLNPSDHFYKSGDECTVTHRTWNGYIGYQWPDNDDTVYWLDTAPDNEDARDDWSDVVLFPS